MLTEIPYQLQNPVMLRRKQSLFAFLIAHLMTWAFEQGYELTCGDFQAFEADKRHQMKPPSTHYSRLAADLNLYIGGVWQTDSAKHKPLGDYWKTLHPLCRWGGDFPKADGNHYSIFNGVTA